MSKTIPEELESILIVCVKQKIMTNTTVLNMSEYERIEMLAKMEEFAFFHEMLKTKTAQELIQDTEIKQLLYGMEETLKKELVECKKLLVILEPETQRPFNPEPPPTTN